MKIKYNDYYPAESDNSKIIVLSGDITSLSVEAIVNSTNHNMIPGGGVNGAINSMAGLELQQETMKFRGIKPGKAYVTKGYNLSCEYIIHTLGPRWYGGDHYETKILGDCYKNSLILAAGLGIRTIAFPCISTGAFKFSKEIAAYVAANTTKYYIDTLFNWTVNILFVCHDQENVYWMKKALAERFESEVQHAS